MVINLKFHALFIDTKSINLYLLLNFYKDFTKQHSHHFII